jgi:hypothetical protein
MSIQRALLLIFTTILCIGAACERKKSVESTRTIPDRPVENEPISAGKSGEKPIDLQVELREDGILLSIKNIPERATINCTMSSIKIEPCHDGALIAKPAPGDYEINVVATESGATLSAAAVKITVLPSNAGGGADVVSLAQQPLAIIIDDVNFNNGMAVKRSQDLILKFRFINKPECEPQVRCNYDSRTTAMWPLCDTPTSKTIAKGVMAAGLQFLTVQASCEGVVGPKLELFWYGVPDNYEPLMLQTVSDTNKRHIFTLIRAEDCAESMLTWKCASPGQDQFTPCDKGNVMDAPPTGFRIKAVCDTREGPAFAI